MKISHSTDCNIYVKNWGRQATYGQSSRWRLFLFIALRRLIAQPLFDEGKIFGPKPTMYKNSEKNRGCTSRAATPNRGGFFFYCGGGFPPPAPFLRPLVMKLDLRNWSRKQMLWATGPVLVIMSSDYCYQKIWYITLRFKRSLISFFSWGVLKLWRCRMKKTQEKTFSTVRINYNLDAIY